MPRLASAFAQGSPSGLSFSLLRLTLARSFLGSLRLRLGAVRRRREARVSRITLNPRLGSRELGFGGPAVLAFILELSPKLGVASLELGKAPYGGLELPAKLRVLQLELGVPCLSGSQTNLDRGLRRALGEAEIGRRGCKGWHRRKRNGKEPVLSNISARKSWRPAGRRNEPAKRRGMRETVF
jgi:hypothetical protein